MTIRQHAQTLNLDARITLYDIDLSELGGPVERVSPMSNVLGTGLVQRVAKTGDALFAMIQYFGTSEIGENGFYVRMVYRYAALTSPHEVRLRMDISNGAEVKTFIFPDLSNPDAAVTEGGTPNRPAGGEAMVQRINSEYAVAVAHFPHDPNMSGFRFFNLAPAANAPLDVVSFGIFAGPAHGVLRLFEDLSDLSDYVESGPGTYEQVVEPKAMGPLRWRMFEYQPRPVDASGFEVAGDGSVPRPRFRMSNVLGIGTALCRQYGDLVGATVTRWTTFARYLDDGLTPDPNAHMPVEQYTIDRKRSHDKTTIEWELASVLDQSGAKLPAREVLRHGCQLSYRYWDAQTGAFRYEGVRCPYVGDRYFNANNESVTDPAQDACSQTLHGCTLRYRGLAGMRQPLPFGGFPSVGRIRR